MSKKVLLLSGGVDSVVAWFYLNKPECVHVVEHSRYSHKERSCVEKLQNKLNDMIVHYVSLPFLRRKESDDETAWIPARNLLFALVGAYFGDEIYIACQRGERDIVDRSDEFFANTSDLLSLHFKTKKVVHPVWVNETKQDLIRWYIDNVGDMDLLKNYTVSCYDEVSVLRCGSCASCFRLAVALVYNDVYDWLTWFDTNPFESPLVASYIAKTLEGKYEDRRNKQMLEALKKLGLV